MVFYGAVMCVGGLGALGYLRLASQVLYEGLAPTATNVLLGLVSAVIDNVPVMFAVLSIDPTMSRARGCSSRRPRAPGDRCCGSGAPPAWRRWAGRAASVQLAIRESPDARTARGPDHRGQGGAR
jgi:hypothetical protein